ncbi:Prefoldin subunit 2 [Halotydeus destructor]|nr:Prefoldin subunit 2 [Halotydeus destructor]
MASAVENKAVKSTNPKVRNEQQILAQFNQLRQDQRGLSAKIVELESDSSEHSLVLDALKDVAGDRKCFRLIGGVLVERTVQEVVPSLDRNKSNLSQLIDQLKQQVVKKGEEINQFMAENNIQIRQGPQQPQQGAIEDEDKKSSSSGVLVS